MLLHQLSDYRWRIDTCNTRVLQRARVRGRSDVHICIFFILFVWVCYFFFEETITCVFNEWMETAGPVTFRVGNYVTSSFMLKEMRKAPLLYKANSIARILMGSAIWRLSQKCEEKVVICEQRFEDGLKK